MKPEIFYAADRARAKTYAMDESTHQYIAALEAIADAAWELHKTIGMPYEKQRVRADKLYDALTRVNFLVEEEDE